MPIPPIPTDGQITDGTGKLRPHWQAFLESLTMFVSPVGQSGTTANRPVDSSRRPLYVGQPYFDTTLGFAVYVKSRNPTVWVDGIGTPR